MYATPKRDKRAISIVLYRNQGDAFSFFLYLAKALQRSGIFSLNTIFTSLSEHDLRWCYDLSLPVISMLYMLHVQYKSIDEFLITAA